MEKSITNAILITVLMLSALFNAHHQQSEIFASLFLGLMLSPIFLLGFAVWLGKPVNRPARNWLLFISLTVTVTCNFFVFAGTLVFIVVLITIEYSPELKWKWNQQLTVENA